MVKRLDARVTYGREIRDRAQCLVEAHGGAAVAVAGAAARDEALPEAERLFWRAVASRIARLCGQPVPDKAIDLERAVS